jgi:hypothetical protein
MPSIYQFTRNNEEREMLRLGLVSRIATPGRTPCRRVPRDHVRAVEAAFLQTLKHPEFVAEAEKTRMTLNPIPGSTVRT